MNILSSLRDAWRIITGSFEAPPLDDVKNDRHLQYLKDKEIEARTSREVGKIVYEDRMNKLEHLLIEAKRDARARQG